MWLKALFLIQKFVIFEVNSYVCCKNEDIRLFYDCTMVKNVIKGYFPISKVLVFEGNSYVCCTKWWY